MALSREQVEKFRHEGYLVVEDFIIPHVCDQLRQRAFQIIAESDVSQHPVITFNAHNNQASTNYFLTSGDKVRFFFEEGAVDEKGELTVPREKAINRIGHGLHVLDPEFKKVTFSDTVKGITKSLELKKPVVTEGMVIFKQPNFGGAVNPHQDSVFSHTTPMNLFGFWIALEDADVENGCLWFVPGSHKYGITKRMVRTCEAGSLCTKFIDSGHLPETNLDYRPEEFIATPVKKGTLVVIHGEVVHKSELNKSQKSRNIYGFHMYDAGTSEWSKDNWLQPTQELAFPFLYD